jgi:glycosyltransferase involved in cell wall biosynthesis
MKENNLDFLSVVLPVFSEGNVVQDTLEGVCGNIIYFTDVFEIIVVNDGSSDQTAAILEAMRPRCQNLRVVTHRRNRGYGVALRSGIEAAQGEWILLMDADGQFRIDSLSGAWPHRHEYDCLLGFRQKRRDPFHRLILGRLGNTVSNLFLSRNILDINCGFKLFRKGLLRELSLVSTGGAINFEILRRFLKGRKRLRIFQFPVQHYSRQDGRATGGDLKVLGKILRDGARVIFVNGSDRDADVLKSQ